MLPAVLLKKLYDGSLRLQNADRIQSLFANELKVATRGKIADRNFFWRNAGLLGKKVLDAFRGGIFPFKTIIHTMIISKEH